MNVEEFLSREKIRLNCHVTSKKRLLESMASLLMEGRTDISPKSVFQILVDRERLGSTGIGHGVALPHGRVPELDQPVAALVVLDEPLDYDSLDHEPVTLVFGLLVPAEATEQHLQILARLAQLFGMAEFRARLMRATSPDEAFELLTAWEPRDIA